MHCFSRAPDGDQPRFLMTGHQFQVVILGVKKGNGAIIVYVYISHRTQSNDNVLELKMVIMYLLDVVLLAFHNS